MYLEAGDLTALAPLHREQVWTDVIIRMWLAH